MVPINLKMIVFLKMFKSPIDMFSLKSKYVHVCMIFSRFCGEKNTLNLYRSETKPPFQVSSVLFQYWGTYWMHTMITRSLSWCLIQMVLRPYIIWNYCRNITILRFELWNYPVTWIILVVDLSNVVKLYLK